ncbi:hypothetical protein MASR1M59_07530 [Melaminivora sp.]
MPAPSPERCPRQQGFTLLEVLVAMTLLGLGLALAFTAASSSARSEEKLASHRAAMQLARSKLDEALAQPDLQIAADPGEEHYAGQDFGYRLRLTPQTLLTEARQARLPQFQQQLELIEIEVFWGPKEAQQSYRLATLRSVAPPQRPAPPAGAAPAGTPPTPVRPQP